MAQDNAQEETVNYGDPTASFSTVGVSASENASQLNMMYGAGSNIFQLDLTANDHKLDSENLSYRDRYFRVTDGLGYSLDILGDMKKDNSSTTALGGIIYKMSLSDNVTVFPMLSAGYTDFGTEVDLKETNKKVKGTALVQGGLYAMYGFDAGHWIYANPKVTAMTHTDQYRAEVDVGGGLMVADNISIGAKLEHKDKLRGKNLNGMEKADTVAWLQANYYF